MSREAPVVGKAYDLCLWLLSHSGAKFPQSYRFVLGERLELPGTTTRTTVERQSVTGTNPTSA